MAYSVSLTSEARSALERIYRFIEAETSNQAASWFNGLETAVQALAKMPQRCPAVREHPQLRHLLYGNKPHVYRVIFTIDEQTRQVIVVDIRHGARHQM